MTERDPAGGGGIEPGQSWGLRPPRPLPGEAWSRGIDDGSGPRRGGRPASPWRKPWWLGAFLLALLLGLLALLGGCGAGLAAQVALAQAPGAPRSDPSGALDPTPERLNERVLSPDGSNPRGIRPPGRIGGVPVEPPQSPTIAPRPPSVPAIEAPSPWLVTPPGLGRRP